jgi:hypothetical protein
LLPVAQQLGYGHRRAQHRTEHLRLGHPVNLYRLFTARNLKPAGELGLALRARERVMLPAR